MKRILCVVLLLILTMSACSTRRASNEYDVSSFSYESDCTYYKDEGGVQLSDFKNTEKSELKTPSRAVELAKTECVVEYDTIDVAFDEQTKVYRISFSKENRAGDNQDVYLSQDGITLMIVFGE